MGFSLGACDVEKNFKSEDLNELLDELSDKYTEIEDTKLRRNGGGIVIYIHFTSTKDTSINPNIYEVFENFFMQKDVAERVAQDYGLSPDVYPNYPSISVYFMDSEEIESHEIWASSYGNTYDEWTEPYYFNKGRNIIGDRASASIIETRKERYDDILKTLLDNKHHTFVSIIYNFGSLKDRHVVLRVTYNTEDEFYESTEAIWRESYEDAFNLVIESLDWKYILKSQRLEYIATGSTDEKYLFGIEEMKEGLIESYYFYLDRNKCKTYMDLVEDKIYTLNFTIEEPNKIISYTISEGEG